MASANQSNSLDGEVLVEEKSFTRIITLNRPKQLNAVSGIMTIQLLKLFVAYEDDLNVNLVILKGKGRAFCAGGDVAAVTQLVREGHWSFGTEFFRKEIILNYILATFRKTQISLLDGIVMGGGAGLSIHGRFRISTENTVFAMPETALGLFPDVGASYFLSRLPGFLGEYCGLTGARLDGAEMLACGLATHYVPSGKLLLLEEALTKIEAAEENTISTIIDQFAEQVPLKKNSALNRMSIINHCFSRRTVEEVLSSLEQEATKGYDAWIGETMDSLKKASPMSLKISLKSIRLGRLHSIDQCLVRDYRIVSHILRKDVNGDFFEGCRAILLDKDKNPKWEPSKLEMINEEMVGIFFSKVKDEKWKDLELPLRRNGVSKL